MSKKNKSKKEKKDDFLKAVIVCMGIFLFFFTIAIAILFYLTGSEPSTLVTCVFAACAGEYSIAGWIENTKVKHKDNDDPSEDNAEDEFVEDYEEDVDDGTGSNY